MTSRKKSVPLAFCLSWGLAYLIYMAVKSWYGLPVKVISAWDLIAFSDLPFAVTFFLIAYSFYCSSAHRLGKILLLIFWGIELVLIVVYFHEYVGQNSTAWTLSIEHWPRSKFLWRVLGEGFLSTIKDILVGVSFFRKTPFYYVYPKINPLQNILLKFTGVLWISTTLFYFILHLLWAKALGFIG